LSAAQGFVEMLARPRGSHGFEVPDSQDGAIANVRDYEGDVEGWIGAGKTDQQAWRATRIRALRPEFTTGHTQRGRPTKCVSRHKIPRPSNDGAVRRGNTDVFLTRVASVGRSGAVFRWRNFSRARAS